MAGDWIKVELATPDKPEIIAIAEALDIDQDAIFGKCMRLWIWADQNVSGFCPAFVPSLSFVDRYTNAIGLGKALVDVGWLKAKDGRFVITNYDRHNGKPAKDRALDASRKSLVRNRTKTGPEKRREEVLGVPNTCFAEFWKTYPQRNGRKVGKKAAAAQFGKLSKEDQLAAILAAGNYAAEIGEFAKDAERFLKAEFWRDWLESKSQASRVATAEDLQNWRPSEVRP